MYLIHTNALQEALLNWATIAQTANGLQMYNNTCF